MSGGPLPRLALALMVGAATAAAFRTVGTVDARWSIGDSVERTVEWSTANLGPLFNAISSTVEYLLNSVTWILEAMPVGVLSLLLIATAWLVVGRGFALFVSIGVAGSWMLGLWSLTLETVALMTTAVMVAVVVGVLVGILMSRSTGLYKITLGLLNGMQSTPVFVYLVPVMFIFGTGPVPAAIVIALYACPPLIRLTSLSLRQTPRASIEAAEAFGASELQTLAKARIPQAVPSILLGLNQAIMLAVSMAIIAAMIGAPGLGRPVWMGVKNLQFGTALSAGLVVVFVAIVLDRLTRDLPSLVVRTRSWLARRANAPGENSAGSLPTRESASRGRQAVRVVAGSAVAVVLWQVQVRGSITGLEGVLAQQAGFDRAITLVNESFGTTLAGLGDAFLLDVLLPTIRGVLSVAWWIVGGLLVTFAVVLGRPRSGMLVAVSLLGIGWMDLWRPSVYSVVLAVAAVVVCILIGVPVALAMTMSRRVSSIVTPVLDFMQTLPVFLYVIPAVILLGIGMVGALLSTVVYCLPIIVRFAKLGLERDGVGPSEVAGVFGASQLQTLFKARIPMALPHLMIGVNQALIFALLMTIVGAFIGAPGLGENVLLSIAMVDLSMGFEAGLAVVLLVIVTHRLVSDLAERTFHGATPQEAGR